MGRTSSRGPGGTPPGRTCRFQLPRPCAACYEQALLESRVDPNLMDSKRNTVLDRANMSSDRAMINLVERSEILGKRRE